LLDWPEILLRLGVATLAGGLIGLDRDLHGKPVGLKTLGLVGLATAMAVVLAEPAGDPSRISDPASRIIQGILTGIGFLGAGVIVRTEHRDRVRGLTSAACTWFAACVGIACGVGQWRIVLVALVIAFTASDRWPPARAMAASHAWREGRARAEIPRVCITGGYATELIVQRRSDIPGQIAHRLLARCAAAEGIVSRVPGIDHGRFHEALEG
jgi:putative Mg2+ transporter-C (MgtC) family protein